jgi:hypothetical protein
MSRITPSVSTTTTNRAFGNIVDCGNPVLMPNSLVPTRHRKRFKSAGTVTYSNLRMSGNQSNNQQPELNMTPRGEAGGATGVTMTQPAPSWTSIGFV